MWEFLVALGVVVALVADAMAIVDSVRRWWEEKTTGRRPKGRPSVPPAPTDGGGRQNEARRQPGFVVNIPRRP